MITEAQISLIVNLVVALLTLGAVWFAKDSAKAAVEAVKEMQKARSAEQELAQLEAYHRGVDEVMKMKNMLHDFNFYPILESSDSYGDGWTFVESQGYKDKPQYFVMGCAILFAAEHVVRMRQRKILSEEEWKSLSKEIELLLLVPFFRNLWKGIVTKELYTNEFRKIVSEFYKRVDANERPSFSDLV